jgi:hypothetical protein
MTTPVTTRKRIVAPRINALLLTLLLLVIPMIFIVTFGMRDNTSTVTFNGVVVTGEERERVLAEMSWTMAKALLPILVIGLWTARRLLPRSPLDYLEITPEGLAVRGISGLSRFAWEAIAEIGIGALPSRVPIAWMKVRLNSGQVRRFYLGGYIRIKLFADLGAQVAEISDWFAQVKSAYIKGNAMGVLPPAPWSFMGAMIELDEPAPGPAVHRSMIER